MGYDTIHNITTKDPTARIVQPSRQAIPAAEDQLRLHLHLQLSGPASVRPHAPVKITGRTYSHDPNGNQTGWTHDTNGTQRTLTWDEENRLQTLADQGHTQQYKYDADGQRTIKRGPQGETVYVNQFYTQRPGATGTKHVYAGTTRDRQQAPEAGHPQRQPAGQDPPTRRTSTSTTPTTWALPATSPTSTASSTSTSSTSRSARSWVEQNSNVQRTPYLFTAKELDEETKLYYFGARYYDPRTSVWQSADPILEKYLPPNARRQLKPARHGPDLQRLPST